MEDNNMPEETTDSAFAAWCVLELMGHRRLGGYVTEAEVGGIPFLRIDVHRGDGSIFTQFYGKSAVYCLTPTTEEIAKAVSRDAGGPVSRWELPQLEAGSPVAATTERIYQEAEEFECADDEDEPIDLF